MSTIRNKSRAKGWEKGWDKMSLTCSDWKNNYKTLEVKPK